MGESLESGAIGALARRARQAAGLSLQEAAARVGCAKSYLSGVENGHRLPTAAFLGRLEEVLGLESGRLATPGAWAKGLRAGGEGVQRAVERMQADQAAGRRLARALREGGGGLDALHKSGELRRLVESLTGSASESPKPSAERVPTGGVVGGVAGGVRRVPLINKVAAGVPREFTDLGYPAHVADEYVLAAGVEDADAFAARVVGASMSPMYLDGDVVIFSPAKVVKDGMDCFARLEPDQETTFKRVYFEVDGQGREVIRLQPLNEAFEPRVLERERVAGLYAAVSVVRKVG